MDENEELRSGSKWRDGRPVALLFAATIVLPSLALAVLAWRALDTDWQLAQQSLRERLRDAARQAHASLERHAFEARGRAEALARGDEPVPGALDQLLVVLAPELRVAPSARIAWIPDGRAPAGPPLPTELEQAEAREQRSGDARAAAKEYAALLEHSPADWRGWLHLRLARSWAHAGERERAVAALREAARLPDSPGPLPTRFAARFELAVTSPGEAARLYRDLCAGVWLLERSPYAFYEGRLRELTGATMSPAESRRQLLARLVDRVVAGEAGWLTEGGTSAQVISAAQARTAAVITLDSQWDAWVAEASQAAPRDVVVRVGAAAGRVSAMSLAPAGLPWSVWSESRDAAARESENIRHRTLMLAILLVVAGALVFGTIATVLMVRRELRVAQLQSDFTATVSHEFRSPLTGIRQLAEMLLAGRAAHDEERRRHYYELICRESDRLSRLVENVLDLSRIEDGRKQYRFEQIATAEWLRGLAGIAGQRRNVEAMVIEPLPAVEGDREALSSAVLNLLDNAIKYSPETAAISLRASGGDGWVTIAVEDHGCGIPVEERERIFDRFYRGANAAGGGAKGVGLGLALVKRIADAHGARLRVESTPGEGSTFYLSLKVAA